MAPSEVEVDAALRAAADAIAAERGETVEEVIDRALRAYVAAPVKDAER
jgi:hypothetical protein